MQQNEPTENSGCYPVVIATITVWIMIGAAVFEIKQWLS